MLVLLYYRASPVAQRVKSLPVMQETRVQFLGWEDPPEKKMATHSSTLACRISWTEEPNGLQTMGLQRAGHNCATNFFTFSWASLGVAGLAMPPASP